MATYMGNPDLVNGSTGVVELTNILAAAGWAELDEDTGVIVVQSNTLNRQFYAWLQSDEVVELHDAEEDGGDVNFFSYAEAGEYVVFGTVTPDR